MGYIICKYNVNNCCRIIDNTGRHPQLVRNNFIVSKRGNQKESNHFITQKILIKIYRANLYTHNPMISFNFIF